MDMLAWRVDAAKGEAGFAPHRDRQPDNAPASFRSDGTAQYTSCWLAVTDANPDSSCLYVIPRGQDPGYLLGVETTLPYSAPIQVMYTLPLARAASTAVQNSKRRRLEARVYPALVPAAA